MTQTARPRSALDPSESDDVAAGVRSLRLARAALEQLEIQLEGPLAEPFSEATVLLARCAGRVVTTGIGKAGFIAAKCSATLASVGTPSWYLHPAEALHGDLGRLVAGDVLLAFSQSGSSEELLSVLPTARMRGVPVVSITGRADNPLGQASTVCLPTGEVTEACRWGLAPTTSTSVQLALADALSVAVTERRAQDVEVYAANHPSGRLGRRLRRVGTLMRTGPRVPTVPVGSPILDAIGVMTRTPGRPGCACVVSADGRLQGVFTDGDLRRLIEQGLSDFTRPIDAVMCRIPSTVHPDARVADAVAVLRTRGIDQLPVVDSQGVCVGLLDVQDLLADGWTEDLGG